MDLALTTRVPTPSPPSEISDLQLHSCSWCRRIDIDPAAAVELSTGTSVITIEFNGEDVSSASRDGCPIFIQISNDMDSSESLTSDTVFLLLELEFGAQGPSGHNLLVRVSGHMQDPISISTFGETFRVFPKSVCYEASVLYGDDSTASFIRLREKLQYVITDETYQRLSEDLDVCDRTHTECGERKFRRGSDSMPSRLVKIDNLSNSIQVVPVVDYSDIRYAALSYCWGGDDSMKLTHTNLELWSRSLSQSELPKTLSDAITFTKKLGLQYIWIDRMCIIQDDEEDKAREIARMPGIFYGAYVTISATNASNCSEGFLHNFDDLAKNVQAKISLRYNCADRGEGRIVLDNLKGKAGVRDSVARRAWTLQEQQLSRRLISCKYDRVDLECLQSRILHRYRVSAPFSINCVTSQLRGIRLNFLVDPGLSSERQMMRRWNYLVRRYSSRKLSYPEDKLPAISAIVECFSGQLRIAGHHSADRGPKYLAGLWDSQFPAALLWRVRRVSSPRPPSYRAPSWSWAAVDDTIDWDNLDVDVPQTGRVFSIIILDAETTPKHSFAPYGQIIAAHLKVKGKLMEGIWHCPDSGIVPEYVAKIKRDDTWNERITVFPDSRDEDMLGDESDPQRVYFLEVASKIQRGSIGLIVVRVQVGIYQRVGLFEYTSVGMFECAEYREIILV